MSLSEAYEMFIREKQAYCAEPSIKYYKENLSKFMYWLQNRFHIFVSEIEVTEIDKACYIDYITYLRKRKCKNVSVRTYCRAIKVFFNWLLDNSYISDNVTKNVRLPNKDNEIIIPLTNKEVETIKELLKENIRNYCFVMLLLNCGLRLSEAMNLKVSDLNYDSLFISIRDSKYNKSRVVPIPDTLIYDLTALISNNINHGAEGKFIFWDRYYKNQLTLNGAKKIFYDLKRNSRIERLHAHLLRHTFATSYIYYGGNLEILRLLLGHASYDITQNYLHIASQFHITKSDIYKLDPIFYVSHA